MNTFHSWKGEVLQHLHQVQEWCKDKPQGGAYTPWVTMLYGSQNYMLATAESDVDTKTMLLPTLKTVLLSAKRGSYELTMPDGSLDAAKDVREMFANYLKGNINFVETLYTPYFWCECYPEFFEELRQHRDLVANSQPKALVHMACGMARQKYVAFDKQFEGKKEVLAKYGYDPKQLHHLVRLYFFMSDFSQNLDFEHALMSCSPAYNADRYAYVMNLKTQPPELEYAKQLREEYMAACDDLYRAADSLPAERRRAEAKEFLDDLSVRLLTKHLREELANDD